MSLGTRIKRLRQDRNWSQAQFALKLKVHQKQISGYERNVHVPSMDLLIRVADLFNVSLDYLAFEDRDDSQQVQIADRDLLQKMGAIDQLTDADRNTVKAVLDTFIIKNQFQQLAAVPKEQTV